MATTAQTGLFGAPSTWVGGSVPALNVDVIVAASHQLIYNMGTETRGNDTTTAWQLLGSLILPHDSTSDLTLRGSLIIANGGLLQAGTTAQPVQSAHKATLRLNNSATMAANKYGLTKNSGGRISLVGAQKTHQTTLAAPVAAAGTSIQVSAASGWQVGDELLLLPSSSAASVTGLIETRFIASGYMPGSLTVPLTAGSTVARSAGAEVINLTKNVLVTESDPAFAAVMSTATDNPADGFLVQDASITLRGTGFGALVTLGSTPVAGGYRTRCLRSVIRQSGGSVASRAQVEYGSYMEQTAFITQSSSNSSSPVSRNGGRFVDCHFISTTNVAIESTGLNSAAATAAGDMDGVTYYGNTANTTVLFGQLSAGGAFKRIKTFPLLSTGTAAIMRLFAPGSVHENCDFAPFAHNRPLFIPVQPSNGRVDYKGSRLPDTDPSYVFGNFPGLYAVFTNCYRRATPSTIVQELWANAGIARQTAAIKENSTHSWEFETKAANTLLDYSFTAPISPGQPRTVKVRLRRDTTYGAGSMPRVRLSIPGQSDVVTAAPDNPDIWYEQTVSITNSGSTAAEVTVAFETVGPNVNGKAWFSGLPVQPFIPAARWYGFVFDEANPFRVADPTITLSEAAAGAVTGVAINHTAGTLTITAARSPAEIGCFAKLDLVNSLDASGNYRPNYITIGADGNSFSTTYTVVIGPGGSISGRYSDANGAVVPITVSNIIAGSSVWIVRTDTSAELARVVAPGTSYSLNVTTAVSFPIYAKVVPPPGPPHYQVWEGTTTVDATAGALLTSNNPLDQ